jgi:hypothetical protein
MPGSNFDEKIRKVRQEAEMLAEEVRILQESADERARAASERARKAKVHFDKLSRNLRQ